MSYPLQKNSEVLIDMAYEVVKAFHDLQDYKDVKGGKVYHHYDVGDTYPRQGLDPAPDETRIEELLSSGNAQGVSFNCRSKGESECWKSLRQCLASKILHRIKN